MQIIKLKTVAEREISSPKNKYHAFMREVSVALGREPRSLDMRKRHPFDLAVVRIPPEAAHCPYHAHSAQWELYVVVAGVGRVRHEGGTSNVSSGDTFLFGPGEAHQISNYGTTDLIYYVIADNPFGTSCYYPDSKKWMVGQPSERLTLKGEKVDYYDGEE
jgi:uncharacterized cupin superfamily protein